MLTFRVDASESRAATFQPTTGSFLIFLHVAGRASEALTTTARECSRCCQVTSDLCRYWTPCFCRLQGHLVPRFRPGPFSASASLCALVKTAAGGACASLLVSFTLSHVWLAPVSRALNHSFDFELVQWLLRVPPLNPSSKGFVGS